MNELVIASIGFIGVIVGAAVSLAGTLMVERRKASQQRRQMLLSLIADAIFSQDLTKVVQSKLWMAIVGERAQLREWGLAQEPDEIARGMNNILLGVVNAERSSLGLEPLAVEELEALIMARQME